MRQRNACFVGIALIVFTLQAAAQTAGDPAAGQLRAGLCAGCHGIPGYRNAYPTYSVPKLGGQHAGYIVSALKAYQTRQRSHPTMQAIAATLSDKDMADLGAYFAAAEK